MSNINALKNQAAKFVVKGNYAKALGIYEKVRELDPEEPGTHNLIGDVYLKMRQKENAISEFKAALDLYKKVQYYPNAIAVCKKILRTDKEQTEIYNDLAGLYVERGFIGEAVINYLEYASRMRKQGEKKEEIEAYRKVIELGPSKIDIRERLVDLYIAEGENEAAIEELERIEELLIQQGKQDKLPGIEEKLAVLKIKGSKLSLSEKKMETGGEKELTVQKGFTIEDMMVGSVGVEEKIEEDAIEEGLKKMDSTGEEVTLESEMEKIQETSIISEAEPVTVENLPPPDKSELQSAPTQWTNFEELAELCLSVNSKNEAVDYLYKAGQIYMEENNYARAVRIYKRIIDIRPIELRPRQKLIEISLKTEDLESAVEWNLDIGRCLFKKGAFNEAEKAFGRALELTSGKDEIRRRIEKIKGKRRVVKKEEVKAPSISLGELLEEEEKKTVKFTVAEEREVAEPVTFEDLLEEFKEGVLENIEDIDFNSHYDLGITYKEMGLLEEAVLEFEKASKGEEIKLKSLEMLALCLIEKGEINEAEKIIKGAILLKSHKEIEFLGLKYSLAQIYERINRNKEAALLFREIIKYDPEFKDADVKLKELEGRISKQKVVHEKKIEPKKRVSKKPSQDIKVKKMKKEVSKEKVRIKRKKKISYI
ncbi:tetratricopeptide repeat protein [candidate division WOR-3 bacterium]|nr:tetratricopeptide repeat protein [candidate division WOR-3 bacterium]